MPIRSRLLCGATGLLFAPLVALAACTTPAPVTSNTDAARPAQPSYATYQCEGGGDIVIENAGAVVRVSVGDDEPVELVAAPPGQRSRYGAEGYALVLEDRDALWMKAGKPPLTCAR
jgi:hypothetical protein